SMPPPSSGGVALIEMLNVLESFDLKAKGFASADAKHLQIEAMRRAYLDRARFLGDPDFVQVPLKKLLSKEYARTLAATIDPARRMLSSMTPTIVSKGGKVVLITGSPGGRTIINTVFCVVLNVTEFGMSVRAAVDAARMDHEWMPDTVNIERAGANEELLAK